MVHLTETGRQQWCILQRQVGNSGASVACQFSYALRMAPVDLHYVYVTVKSNVSTQALVICVF